MSLCPKCNVEYPSEYPHCPNPVCRRVVIKGLAFPDEGGRLMYVWGYRYPMLGFPEKDRLDATATLKRAFLETVKILAKDPFFYFQLVFMRGMLLRNLQGWIERVYAADYEKKIKPLIEKNWICRSGVELRRVLNKLFGDHAWIDCIIGIWDTDFAYRYRPQDYYGAILIDEMRRHPRSEILRVLKIGISRERSELVKEKMEFLRKLLYIPLFLSPKFVGALQKIILELDPAKICLTVNDLYWCGHIFDLNYNFNGKSWEEQHAYSRFLEEGWKEDGPIPEPPPIPNQ